MYKSRKTIQTMQTVQTVQTVQAVHNFISLYLAIYRPIKKTYYLLQWHNTVQRWNLCTNLIEPRPAVIEKCKSRRHPGGGTVNIKIWSGSYMNVSCDSTYLKYGDLHIPIGKRAGGYNISSALLRRQQQQQREFTATAGPFGEQNVELWTVLAPAAATAATAPTATATIPLPKRIAWLIADDASRNNEICSITMDPISPLTASVTSCFHCYDSTAIEAWLLNKPECPQCRTKCIATRAFVEN